MEVVIRNISAKIGTVATVELLPPSATDKFVWPSKWIGVYWIIIVKKRRKRIERERVCVCVGE